MKFATADIMEEVGDERAKQDAKWGEQNHPDRSPWSTNEDVSEASDDTYDAKRVCEQNVKDKSTNWVNILLEEFCEAVEEAERGNETELRAELIQVAAVAAAWVECIDRRKK